MIEITVFPSVLFSIYVMFTVSGLVLLLVYCYYLTVSFSVFVTVTDTFSCLISKFVPNFGGIAVLREYRPRNLGA